VRYEISRPFDESRIEVKHERVRIGAELGGGE